MKLSHRIISLAAALLGLSGFAHAQSVRDLKYEITDTAIVFPESQQADVHRLQQNWYLRNYTVLDTIGRPDVPASDEVITRRLHSLPTTIEMPFNPVVRDYVNLYTQRRRSLVETMLGLSLYYMPIFEVALEKEGLPLELRNLPIIESALNPNAVSRAGATGLWQFMLPTARGLGLEINTLVDERRDPIAASEAAARYLSQLYDIYKDWSLAIAAYNCGPGNINKALARAGATAENPKDYWDIYYHLPAETRGYVPGFIGATYAMTYYADHGISPALAKRPILTDTVHVNSRIHFTAISNVLNIPVDELRVLNPQYRKDIIPGDTKPYALRLPSQLIYTYLMYADSIRGASEALASRATVEIGGRTIAANGEGTYKEVTKRHRVRRGETLASIAADFGVTVRQIKKWNGLRSSRIRRGSTLKIRTKEFVPAPPEQQTSPAVADTAIVEQVDSTALNAPSDTTAQAAAPEPDAEVEDEAEDQPEPAKKKTATKTHRVSRGETLYAISKKYGVTISRIKEVNNLSSDRLTVGQRLKIPQK